MIATCKKNTWKSEWRTLALCFGIPALLMLGLYIGMGHHPIGDASTLILDLNAQYAYFLEGLRDILRGDGSFLYSFSRALGGEFPGMFAYYLASPLNLLVLLFPREQFLYFLLVILVLKTGLCGLSMGYYLRFARRRSRECCISVSVMYALCAYCIVMQHNLMWTDNIILLPLICFGLEDLVQKGRHGKYVFALTLAIITNFYIGYMSCIFSAFYFFAAWLQAEKEKRKPFGVSLLRMGVWSAVSGAMSAILVIPAYYSLTFGKTTFSNPDFSFVSRFDYLDLLGKFYPGSFDTVQPKGLPFVSCGVIALILFLAFFFVKSVRPERKIAVCGLCVLLCFSFSINTVDMVWHGFQLPNWLNYRYAYMLCFVMLSAAADALDAIRRFPSRWLYSVSLTVFLIPVLLQALGYQGIGNLPVTWIAMGFSVFAALSLFGIRHIRESALSKKMLCLFVCLEMVGSAALNMYGMELDVIYSSWSSYEGFLQEYREAADAVAGAEDSFYRTEKAVHRRSNDNFALGLHGLSNSTSTLNAETIRFLHRMGLAAESHWSKYLGSTPVTDALLGVKYILYPSEAKMPGQVPPSLYTQYGTYGTVSAYQNPYALSLAFAVPRDAVNLTLSGKPDEKETEDLASPPIETEKYASPMQLQNAWLRAMGAPSDVYLPVPSVSQQTDQIRTSTVAGHEAYRPRTPGAKATITFHMTSPANGRLYLYLPTDYPREMSMQVNEKEWGTVLGNETKRILEIGEFQAGDSVSVSLTLKGDVAYIRKDVPLFWYIDEEALAAIYTDLSDGCWNITKWQDNRLEGSITVSEKKPCILTTIPYDEGWHVILDGKEIPFYKAMEALIAFDASPGEHHLKMIYFPNCYRLAILVSLSGMTFLIAFTVIQHIWKRRKHRDTTQSSGTVPH